MKLVVTGADRPLGALLCRGLAQGRELAPAGAGVDLRSPEQVAALLQGAQAIVHTLPFDPPMGSGPEAEGEVLDLVARSTYVLVQAACQAGIGRMVLVSQLSLLEAYPAEYEVGPDWEPRPRAEGLALAPYLAELTCREICRLGRIEVICLRLGALDAPEGTSGADALKAVEEALAQERQEKRGYHWSVHHVASTGRFATQKEGN
jgi:nucleoside-diphosphate-sugar epimerase